MNEPTGTAPFLSNSASARDRAFVLHPMTNLVQHAAEGPLIIARGDGIYIIDDQGRRFIEGAPRFRRKNDIGECPLRDDSLHAAPGGASGKQ